MSERIGTPQEMQVWLGEQRERIRELERELLVRVGVCRNRVCELHRDHFGACRIPGCQDVSSDLV